MNANCKCDLFILCGNNWNYRCRNPNDLVICSGGNYLLWQGCLCIYCILCIREFPQATPCLAGTRSFQRHIPVYRTSGSSGKGTCRGAGLSAQTPVCLYCRPKNTLHSAQDCYLAGGATAPARPAPGLQVAFLFLGSWGWSGIPAARKPLPPPGGCGGCTKD